MEYYFIKLDIKWIPLLIITAINVGLWQLYAVGAENDAGAIKDALSQLSSALIWLVVVVFMIAQGLIKTGLGCRIAPAMPSNIARCGGIIYPITDSLSRNFESYPENEYHSKVRAFLVSYIGNMNDIKTKKVRGIP